MLQARTAIAIAACAIAALAAWPFAFAHVSAHVVPAMPATPAPIVPDYRYRDGMVTDLERLARVHPDQLDEHMLAVQYLQRYREAPDVGDLLRAIVAARRSLRYQPRYNVGAESALASAYASLHKFRIARRYASELARWMPWDSGARASLASLDMELGDYADARHLLDAPPSGRIGPAWETALARYDELTGDLGQARAQIELALRETDSRVNEPAEVRAWYHWRAGELAFMDGDLNAAQSDYRDSLAIFPGYWHANAGLARVNWARRRWRDALAAADLSANVYPLPETLGYKADAQQALGDLAGARATQALIEAIERLGDLQGVNDRLIASYYSEHGIRLAHAVEVAQRDLRNRDDIYAEDTLAWALAMAGRWEDALPHARRAAALGTKDARVMFHVGMIALHNGEISQARVLLAAALALNPHFHPYYADDARAALARLNAAATPRTVNQARGADSYRSTSASQARLR